MVDSRWNFFEWLVVVKSLPFELFSELNDTEFRELVDDYYKFKEELLNAE